MNTNCKRKIVKLAALVMILFFSTETAAIEAFAKQKTENCNIVNTENSDLKAELINAKEWAVSDITEIQVNYYTDYVKVMPSENQNIILKEYLSENASQYYAQTSITDSVLRIDSGERPDDKSYISNIEIYIPAEFTGTISLATTTGTLEVENLTAAKLILKSQTGGINVSNSSGHFDCEAATGSITIQDGSVWGSFTSTTGSVKIASSQITGDITANSRTGSIKAMLSQETPFSISASTKTGAINNNFSDTWSITDHVLVGTWGTDPTIAISLTTATGTVDIGAK